MKLKNAISKKLRAQMYYSSLSPEKKALYKSANQIPNLSSGNSYISNSCNDSFIQRNYQSYLEKEKKNIERIKSNILSKTDLETILYNLKKNYNLIMEVTQQRNVELNRLSNKVEKEEEKLNKLIDFKEIELPEEKISLRKLGDTNLTKEQLRSHLFEL